MADGKMLRLAGKARDFFFFLRAHPVFFFCVLCRLFLRTETSACGRQGKTTSCGVLLLFLLHRRRIYLSAFLGRGEKHNASRGGGGGGFSSGGGVLSIFHRAKASC